MNTDTEIMRRALQLAGNGRGYTSPNPMVGAVITAPDGRIIGEGWHRAFGGPHAEVNAVASVADADRALLPQATVYVTLEPCSHYGKTPPCAKLLVETGFRRCVIATLDPNPKVAGRGAQMLRDAGIAVEAGLMETEARHLNKTFFTAHTLHRPFVTLKWAQNHDGFMDGSFSTPLTAQIVHSRRAVADLILIGAGTAIADNPRLDVRHIAGRSPRPVILDRRGLVNEANCDLLARPDTIHITSGASLQEILASLYAQGYVSVLVEGGASVLGGFIGEGLWDEAFVELAHTAAAGRVRAPLMPCGPSEVSQVDGNMILNFKNSANVYP